MNQSPQPKSSSFSRWVRFIRALVSAAILVAVLPGLLMRGFQKKEAIDPNARRPSAAELRAAREGQMYTVKKRVSWLGAESAASRSSPADREVRRQRDAWSSHYLFKHSKMACA